jgi:hypothetical protein
MPQFLFPENKSEAKTLDSSQPKFPVFRLILKCKKA